MTSVAFSICISLPRINDIFDQHDVSALIAHICMQYKEYIIVYNDTYQKFHNNIFSLELPIIMLHLLIHPTLTQISMH